MILDFSQLNEPEISFAHVYAADEIDLDDETASVAQKVEVAGTARKNTEVAVVKADLRGTIEIECSRCLHPVEFRLDTKFAAEFVTLENYEKSSAEHELHGADFEVSIYDGDRIDLKELVREQIILNLPMHQLCSETCAGFCQTCGKNKNKVSCNCTTEEIDPRWSALKKLKIEN